MNETNNHKSRVGLMTMLAVASGIGVAHSFPGSPWNTSLSMTETDEKLQDADLERIRAAEQKRERKAQKRAKLAANQKGKAHV